MTLEHLKSKKLAIVGLGVNNKHLTQYFQAHKIKFEVIDGWRSPDDLIGKLDKFDILFRTPGLPYLSPAIQQAKQKGVEIYSQTKLFFDLCPAQIIGVTGTKGKGTTATLISRILEAGGKKVWLGGNIGNDPFEFLDQISPSDSVILELSSFQLQDLHKSPHIAVVLKITPEHLDHHKTVEEYIDAKKSIVAYQSAEDFTILNYDHEVTRGFAPLTKGRIVWNSTVQTVRPGCFIRDEKIVLNVNNSPPPLSYVKRGEKPPLRVRGGEGELLPREMEIMPVSDVQLLGRFNLENVTAAVAAAAGATDPSVIRKAASEFKGLSHRLEFVAEVKGVKFYNDSISTTPETAMAAISAFSDPLIMVVGGSEKGSDYQELALTIAKSQIKALLAIGLTGPRVAKLARERGFNGRIVDHGLDDMEKIVGKANELAREGDIVLLSPASASFDMFKNYKHRGELFKKFVQRL